MTTDELFIEGIAAGTERVLLSEKFVDLLAEKVASAIAARFELLNPEEAAALLDVTPRTLNDNRIAWHLDKSLAFGAANPKYFLSQILERARAKMLNGNKKTPNAQRPTSNLELERSAA